MYVLSVLTTLITVLVLVIHHVPGWKERKHDDAEDL